MTAEIAIMNKEAVALAADSAVTLPGAEKIFTSANKIFNLSKYHPVGIMVYGNASFMSVPWETIIKIYRSGLGEKGFDSLEEYADDFLSFLNRDKKMFPESEQEKYVQERVYIYFYLISEQIKKRIEKVQSEKNEVSEDEIKGIISEVVEERLNIWKNADFALSIPKDHIQKLLNKYETIINEAKKEVFKGISKVTSGQLTEIAVSLFVKFPDTTSYSKLSGVVIAGLGKKDIFPSLKSFLIEGMANNCLKYKKYGHTKITFENGAAIVPFAQSEMVYTFMQGIEPNYNMILDEYLAQIFKEYPEAIIDSIDKLNDGEKSDLKQKLKDIGIKEFQKYKEKMKNYRGEKYINPVLDVVASLPKDELAAMAESLVNLTSFKRKVSMEAETVGGPIDVAVISKGDGFIWIKRKHYFEGVLNPQFLANYYREVENAEE